MYRQRLVADGVSYVLQGIAACHNKSNLDIYGIEANTSESDTVCNGDIFMMLRLVNV